MRGLTGLPIEIAYGDVLVKNTLTEASRGCQYSSRGRCVCIYRSPREELNSVAVDISQRS